MADSFTACLAFVIKAEGGWSDDPHDAGGCTMVGVTLPSLQGWKHDHTLTCDDLRLVTAQEISDLYYQTFWLPCHGQIMAAGVDLMVFDAGINMGLGRSIKILQRCLDLTIDADGIIGMQTIAALIKIEPSALIEALARAQIAFYQSLPSFSNFGHGWINRVNARHAAAIAMMSLS